MVSLLDWINGSCHYWLFLQSFGFLCGIFIHTWHYSLSHLLPSLSSRPSVSPFVPSNSLPSAFMSHPPHSCYYLVCIDLRFLIFFILLSPAWLC